MRPQEKTEKESFRRALLARVQRNPLRVDPCASKIHFPPPESFFSLFRSILRGQAPDYTFHVCSHAAITGSLCVSVFAGL